jgi:iron(III) transport system substrate-binding protein
MPAVAALVLILVGCNQRKEGDLVIYSGRSETLVDPILDRFEREVGGNVAVRYGDTAQLAVALTEEGVRTRADLYWGQDAGSLGALHADGLLAAVPDSILQRVPERYRNEAGTWIATSGRARTLAYSSSRIDPAALPAGILELADRTYRGRVGWAPTNGSFQSHITAIRKLIGDDRTRAWLVAMRENGTKSYRNNTAILQAIADGEIDFGLPNHYYLYRFKSEDAAFPVEQTFFAPGDAGNLINVAGIGVLKQSGRQQEAFRVLSYLLSEDAQRYFTDQTFEYPVIDGIEAGVRFQEVERLRELAPPLDLDALRDLEGTLQLLREARLL